VRQARDRVLASYGGQTVVLVSHVTPIKTLLRFALDAPPTALYRMHLDLASLSEVQWFADGPAVVRSLNDTGHLPSSGRLRQLRRRSEVERRTEAAQRLEVHLQAVAPGRVDHAVQVRWRIRREEAGELGEVVLEAGLADDLEQPRFLVAGVEEGVPLVARLADEVPGPGLRDLLASTKPTRPSVTTEYSSSRWCRCIGAASSRGCSRCSTTEKRPPVADPGSRVRAVMPPSWCSSPSPGPTSPNALMARIVLPRW
jgi:hypothetical protein